LTVKLTREQRFSSLPIADLWLPIEKPFDFPTGTSLRPSPLILESPNLDFDGSDSTLNQLPPTSSIHVLTRESFSTLAQ
jgi:hypothetical protein